MWHGLGKITQVKPYFLVSKSLSAVVGREQLEAELDRLAKRGVGMNDEEFILGVVAVAIPVGAPDGKVVAAAICCHEPIARMTTDDWRRGKTQLRSAADEVAGVLFS